MENGILENKLNVGATLKEGINIGVKNIGPILVNVLLWGLTLWIPYLNVGTTIGLFVGIVSKASKGEAIDMSEIFDPKYRKFMGEFFLTSGLIGIGVGVGMIFFIIPGIVIGLAWSLALLLVIDKGKNPSEALTISNNCTYGYKWKMFGIYAIISLALFFSITIFSAIFGGIGAATRSWQIISFMGVLIGLFSIAASLFAVFINIGIQASIYRQLTENV